MDLEPWTAAGLYDPGAPDAAERRELLEYLASLGLSVDDVREATAARRIGRLAADHVLWGDAGADLTVADVAARADMPDATVRRIIRAAGLADAGDEPTYRAAHVELFRAFAIGAAIFGDDAILQFTRVMGSAAARVAEAAISSFTANVSPRLDADNASQVERVRQSAEAVRAFGLVPGAIDILLREHFLAAVRRMGLLDVGEGGTTAVTIAFVDLVESTQFARRASPAQLATALGDFEAAAMDAGIAHDCRVVKLIGDEVMLAGADATATLAVVNELLAAVEDHPLLGTGRAGVAAGYAVARDGDYFGPVVNLAARLTSVATAGEALLDEQVAARAEAAGYRVEPVVSYTLKGFNEPVPARRLTR